jgi:CheY-like chemotaxis protein
VFHVYFPVAANGDDFDDRLPPEVPRGAGERILCVDDDPVVLSACAEMLEDLGYSVTALDDPRVAREEFRSRPESFDLLVTDLSMPGMSGLDLIRDIRLIAPDLPAILSSGWNRGSRRGRDGLRTETECDHGTRRGAGEGLCTQAEAEAAPEVRTRKARKAARLHPPADNSRS